MTPEEITISRDRMRFTKDTLSANAIIVAIVLDCLYFVSIYQSDVSTWYYNWVIGASIIFNLLFLLTAFLASEGVKNRKTGFTIPLIVLGALIKRCLDVVRYDLHGYAAVLFMLVYLVIASFAEPAFFNAVAVPLAVAAGTVFYHADHQKQTV